MFEDTTDQSDYWAMKRDRDEWKARADELMGEKNQLVMLKELHVSGNRFEMTLEPAKEIMCHIVDACRVMVSTAPNYVECSVRGGGDQYWLTIRKAAGKTDHQMRMEAEKDRDYWRLTAAQVEQRCIALLKRHGVDVAGLAVDR